MRDMIRLYEVVTFIAGLPCHLSRISKTCYLKPYVEKQH